MRSAIALGFCLIACGEGTRAAAPDAGTAGDATRASAAPSVPTLDTTPSFAPVAEMGPSDARRVSVAVADDDRVAVTWTTVGTPVTGHAFFADEARGFTPEHLAAALDGLCSSPTVALSAGGKAIVAFQVVQSSEGRVMIATRENRSERLRAPTGLNDSISLPGLHAYEPVAFATPDGEQLVVWNQWRGTGFSIALADRPAGGAWQLPKGTQDLLSYPIFHSNGPRPVISDAGAVVVSWHQSPGAGDMMVWVSERARRDQPMSRPGPTDFISTPGVRASSGIFANSRPALAADGRAAVGWTQDTGPGDFARVFVAVRAAGATFQRGMPVATVSDPDATASNVHPFFIGATLHVIWEEELASGARRVVFARQEGSGWSRPAAISTAGLRAAAATVGVGPRTVVAWAEGTTDGYRVMARVFGSDGSLGRPIEISPPTSEVSDVSAAVGSGKDSRVAIAWTHRGLVGSHVRVVATRRSD